MRQAVGWSYDLLGEDERLVLNHVSVFAGGFDLAAAVAVVGQDSGDEYALLDVVDSLVRKSLVVVERVGGHARYGLLETIRQFGEDQLAATGTIGEVRDRHARYFAGLAVAYWGMWDGPGQGVAVDGVDVEFANLRAGFRWAADQDDLATAGPSPPTRPCWARRCSVRAGRVGRGDPGGGHRRRAGPAAPSLHRRQLLRARRTR